MAKTLGVPQTWLYMFITDVEDEAPILIPPLMWMPHAVKWEPAGVTAGPGVRLVTPIFSTTGVHSRTESLDAFPEFIV